MTAFPAADEDGFTLAEAARLTGVSRETSERIEVYIACLGEWRDRLNLIGPGEGRHLWRRHVLDSLQLVPLIQPSDARIVDIGSGAGFPGIILGCSVGPGHTVTLVEKSPRKAEFLEAAVEAAGLKSVVLCQRIEDGLPKVAKNEGGLPFDLVTARALAPLDKLIGYAAKWSKPGGRSLFIKGRGANDEAVHARALWSFGMTAAPSLSSAEGQVLAITNLRPLSK